MIHHLREDMKEIKNTLKWGIIILIGILTTFGSVVGANTIRSVKNKKDIDRYKLAIQEMVTKQQMSRLIEFSKIRKDIIKATMSEHSDEELDILWSRLEDIERMVIEDDYGFYLRGVEEESYKDKIKKQY